MKRITILSILILIVATSVVAQTKVEDFDKYAEAARQEWKVPGMAITIVQDGKVILAKGYGVRESGKDTLVDADTLFGAMSTTKAMTAVTMGMLVDEGKVSWDDKVIKHLPDFRVADAYVTSELRIRDLFTHNGGMGNADFLWTWTPELSAAEIVKRMQYARPAYPFRGGYTYQNVMYAVAGQVVEKVSGMPWERFATERLFGPLGMKNTFATYGASKSYQNRSVAHVDLEGTITAIPEQTADPIAPAGAVWSTANDIAKWVDFMLTNPTVNGKQLLKPATFQALLRPQVIVWPPQYPTATLTKPHWSTYGLGWFQQDYRGEMVNFHTGSLAGRTAIIGLIPDKKMGIYIFGNVDHAEVRHALMYKAFDMFAFGDSSGRDWSKEMKTLYDGLEAQGKKQAEAQKARRHSDTKPSVALTAYAGKYSDPLYGEIDIIFTDGKLQLSIGKGDMRFADLEHWHHDTFVTKWRRRWLGEGLVSFQLNAVSGEVEALTIGGAQLRRVRS